MKHVSKGCLVRCSESGTVARVQPCKPVGGQYGGGGAICAGVEVIQSSGTSALHQSRSHSLTQPSAPPWPSSAHPRARPAVARCTGQEGSRHPTWGALRARSIAISSSAKCSWREGERHRSALTAYRNCSRAWRRASIAIISSCLSTRPTLCHAALAVYASVDVVLLILCHCV